MSTELISIARKFHIKSSSRRPQPFFSVDVWQSSLPGCENYLGVWGVKKSHKIV